MKKLLYLLIFISIGLLISCNNPKQNKSSNKTNETINNKANINALIPDKVIIYDEVNFMQQSIHEWVLGVDTIFMTNLNEQVINSEIQLYSSNIYYDPDLKLEMTDKDIYLNMNTQGSISSLYFIENWNFNKNTYKLDKQIESWSPVYEFYKKYDGEIDSSKKAKKLLYDVRTKLENNTKLIAKNIIYEINFSEDRKTNDYLDLNKLSHLIIDPILTGDKKAVDFFEKTELKPIDIKYDLGYRLDSLEEENPNTGEWVWKRFETKEDLSNIEAFIFIEDWYLDTKTFAIKKEVKSIAPVIIKTKIDEDGESYISKKIVFLVNL